MSHVEAVAAGLITKNTISTTVYQLDDNITRLDWPDSGQFPGVQPLPVPNAPTVIITKNLQDQIDNMKTEAVKADAGKVDWSLVPFEALEGMAQVLTFGAKKYDSWNWTTNGGFQWMRVFASTMRHLFAWSRGEDNDPESGLSHISHAQCNLLFLAFYVRNKSKFNKDNRNVR